MANKPPRNIDELRKLYAEIIKSGRQKHFGLISLRIFRYMLDSPAEVAVKSISQIANEHGTNSSTVTRLAQRLGFLGFSDYQQIFRDYVREGASFYSTQVKNFLESSTSRSNSADSILQQVIHEEWGNVMATLDQFDKRKFKNVVSLILKANRISILGLRSVFTLAFYFEYYFKLISGNIRILGGSGHTLAEDLAHLGEGDLLLAISVKPYTKNTIIACQEAKRQGAELVTITDSYSSPIAIETKNSLIVSSKGPYFFTPLVSLVIYMEALLSELVKSLGDKAIDKLKRTEELFERMNIETEG
ncbi:MAG: hypothetical protein AVO38_13900 [delta proteobacterium ML8_D]|jgi:DNA-binding MurR/RpiR family transcriptional regulator|nr:MAG: hypothetical protein AVO38_13900 [delta proteobacterium ML8_D]